MNCLATQVFSPSTWIIITPALPQASQVIYPDSKQLSDWFIETVILGICIGQVEQVHSIYSYLENIIISARVDEVPRSPSVHKHKKIHENPKSQRESGFEFPRLGASLPGSRNRIIFALVFMLVAMWFSFSPAPTTATVLQLP